MKKQLLNLMIVVFAIGISAFNINKAPSLLLKKYVGVSYANGKYYLEYEPGSLGTVYEIPSEWQEGLDYYCSSYQYNSLCTVSTVYYTYPEFDFNTGYYYLFADDVVECDQGIYFIAN